MPETSTLSVTINGRRVEAKAGSSVLDACRDVGIRVPTLCHDPRLEPFGGCRLCIVEIEGIRGYPTACTTRVAEGMTVTTDSEQLRQLRSAVVELLLSDHNVDCLTCEKGGSCALQDLAYEFGVDGSRLAGAYHESASHDDDPLIVRDLSKCIACGKCVRICEEVQGVNVYGYRGRGFDVLPRLPYDCTLADAGCEFCGQCVSTCPVGALRDRPGRDRGRSWEIRTVRSICGYCGVGCTIDFQVKDGRVVGASAPLDAGVNRGNLCAKGRYGWRFTHDPERLTTPLVRKDGQLTAVTWDEAVALVAKRLGDIAEEYGPDAVAGLASAKCTNEENYLFQKFMRTAISTNNIDHCARL